MKLKHSCTLCLVIFLTMPLTTFAKVVLECRVSGEVKYTSGERVTTESLPSEQVIVTIDDTKPDMTVRFKSAADYSFFMGDFLKTMTVRNISDDKFFKWSYSQNIKVSKTHGMIEIDRHSLRIKVSDAWSHKNENLTTVTEFSGVCSR